MDLDFSFALVSSLTPRSQTIRSPLSINNKLTSKSLKTKQNQSVPSKSKTSKLSHQENRNNKENRSPKGLLMIKNENSKVDIVHKTKCIDTDIGSDTNGTSSFPISLVNVSVRKNRFRSKNKSSCSPLQLNENISISPKKGIQNKNSSPIRSNNLVSTTHNSKEEHFDNSCQEVIGESPAGCSDSLGSCFVINKGVKRKSFRLAGSNKASLSGNSSPDFVESPCSEIKNVASQIDHNFCKDTNMTERIKRNSTESVKRNFTKNSVLSGTSLSPAYDSDSFIRTRRRSVKVIPETPETDQSLQNDTDEKAKCNIESVVSKKYKDKRNNRSSNCENEKNKSESYYSTVMKNSSPYNKLATCFSNSESDMEPKKKLRSSNESSLTDMFRFESSIKSHSNSPTIKNTDVNGTKEKANVNCAKKDKRKLSMSPVLKEINKTDVDCKKSNHVKEKKIKNKEAVHRKLKGDVEEENICKTVVNGKKNKPRTSNTYLINSPVNIGSTKSSLVLPSEVIPKFEHINNWLKETQDKSIISLSSESSLDSPKKSIKLKRQKSKNRLTISPRIKSKIKIAQSTLQEEQRVFEEVHGSNMVQRLSEDVEEVLSVASSSESVELSEKVLEKLYGSVWQKNVVVPHTEPRKTRKKNSSKKKTPLTEKKKQRTSIYDVFSSSSSEDRFEEFLESVRRGKFEPTRRHSSRPGTPDFINDSTSDSNCSLVFYHNVVSSAVKEEVNQLRHKDRDNASSSLKDNRRRLSFTSSKDDCSESGKSDGKPATKGKKPSTKERNKNNPKPRTKKNAKDSEETTSSDIIGFTLVTPIKLKNKTEDELQARIKNVIKPEVPRSVGKSKTPKNPTNRDDNLNSEVKLSTKLLVEGDFKVPKHLSSLKTPTKPIQRDVPSSPALSFLSSLSEMTAGLPSHPDALVFKKNFKSKREELTKKLFSLYNKEVFENKLPADMSVQWSTRMTSTSGYCYNKRTYSNNQIFRSSRIVLSTKILDRADRLRDTLIHELCHAATWIVNATSDGHGPNWRAWADKANRRFPELPVIKRCHDYAISTKFTYKCMSCGYCIGRHSKSLDTERKRCGYCYGRFQMFVTAKMSAASATSDSDSVKTPRNPTGFALFVKDNYAAVKKENNVPHGQVMKLLSKKFAEVKISKQSEKEPT